MFLYDGKDLILSEFGELTYLVSRDAKMVYARVCRTPARSAIHKRPVWSFHSKEPKKCVYGGWDQVVDSYGTRVSYGIHLCALYFPS